MPAEIVYDLAQILDLEADHAFIVGGQALNLWAERYHEVPELADYGPYTSKDLDYFGFQKAAAKLAKALKGTLRIPNMDNATPQTAIVEAHIDGQKVEIDFLGHVKGVKQAQLERNAVELILNVKTAKGIGTIRIPIMHPLHCFQSRLGNVIGLGRTDDTSKRQLEASPIILREYISEALDDGDEPEAQATLKLLFEYLRSDEYGRQAHRVMDNDPVNILKAFRDDPRLDSRFRGYNVASMLAQLGYRRNAAAARLSKRDPNMSF